MQSHKDVRRRENWLKGLRSLGRLIHPGSENYLVEDLLNDFGFFVRDALPYRIMFWRPRDIASLEEVERTGLATPMGRDRRHLAPVIT
jgi:hypothetical protein